MHVTKVWVALALVALGTSPVSAQITTPCATNNVKFETMAADDCDGLFGGNDSNNEAGIAEYLDGQFGGEWYVSGKSDNTGGAPNPFVNIVGLDEKIGSFALNGDITGAFAISMKFGNNYGAYFFDTDIVGRNFTFTSPLRQGGGFSHASLWRVRECTIDCNPDTGIVPEPSSFALMFGGLLGLTAAARRRRKV